MESIPCSCILCTEYRRRARGTQYSSSPVQLCSPSENHCLGACCIKCITVGRLMLPNARPPDMDAPGIRQNPEPSLPAGAKPNAESHTNLAFRLFAPFQHSRTGKPSPFKTACRRALFSRKPTLLPYFQSRQDGFRRQQAAYQARQGHPCPGSYRYVLQI